MQNMKSVSLLLCSSLLFITNAVRAETLFGGGIITVATNETILVTTLNWNFNVPLMVNLDGIDITLSGAWYYGGSVLAITGPRKLSVTNPQGGVILTFQRLTNSPVQTIMTGVGTTNVFNVPNGKTVQFFHFLGERSLWFQPNSSTNWFQWYSDDAGTPSVSGPLMVRISPSSGPAVWSYYFTDDVVQFPPNGLVTVPAPVLQVNIEKSYNLTNWIPTATFHTEAEAEAFYRLRMLK